MICITSITTNYMSSHIQEWPDLCFKVVFLGFKRFFLPLPGGSLSGDMVTDEELFIRWLEVAAFLPVLSFHTPPWVYGEEQVGSCLGGCQLDPG